MKSNWRVCMIVLVVVLAQPCPAADPRVTQGELERVRQSITQQDNGDLRQLDVMLRRVFDSEDAQKAYFTSPNGRDQYVRWGDLQALSRALIQHGARAAMRRDWQRSQKAFELAVDVCLSPTRLTPPERITIESSRGAPFEVPGSERYVYVTLPTSGSMDLFQRALRPVDHISEQHAKCLRSTMTQIWHLQHIIREYARAQLALRDDSPGKSTRSVRLFKNEQAVLQKELPTLRQKISDSINCIWKFDRKRKHGKSVGRPIQRSTTLGLPDVLCERTGEDAPSMARRVRSTHRSVASASCRLPHRDPDPDRSDPRSDVRLPR